MGWGPVAVSHDPPPMSHKLHFCGTPSKFAVHCFSEWYVVPRMKPTALRPAWPSFESGNQRALRDVRIPELLSYGKSKTERFHTVLILTYTNAKFKDAPLSRARSTG